MCPRRIQRVSPANGRHCINYEMTFTTGTTPVYSTLKFYIAFSFYGKVKQHLTSQNNIVYITAFANQVRQNKHKLTAII